MIGLFVGCGLSGLGSFLIRSDQSQERGFHIQKLATGACFPRAAAEPISMKATLTPGLQLLLAAVVMFPEIAMRTCTWRGSFKTVWVSGSGITHAKGNIELA